MDGGERVREIDSASKEKKRRQRLLKVFPAMNVVSIRTVGCSKTPSLPQLASPCCSLSSSDIVASEMRIIILCLRGDKLCPVLTRMVVKIQF